MVNFVFKFLIFRLFLFYINSSRHCPQFYLNKQTKTIFKYAGDNQVMTCLINLLDNLGKGGQSTSKVANNLKFNITYTYLLNSLSNQLLKCFFLSLRHYTPSSYSHHLIPYSSTSHFFSTLFPHRMALRTLQFPCMLCMIIYLILSYHLICFSY